MKFNPNEHSKKPLQVYIKRLKKTLKVEYANILMEGNGYIVWGFAEGKEFDTSWGDKISI